MYKEKECKFCRNKFRIYKSTDKCKCQRKPIEFKPKKPIVKKAYAIPKLSKTNKVIKKAKSLSDYKSDLQKEINAIVREIDKEHSCICNLNKPMKLITAGHLWSVGSNDTIRFNLLNIWGQDYNSNGHKGGEPLQFKHGLITLYGMEFWEQLEALKSIKPINLNIDEIKEKITICRGIIKWLKLQDRKFEKYERLSLRILFNTKIGIY